MNRIAFVAVLVVGCGSDAAPRVDEGLGSAPGSGGGGSPSVASGGSASGAGGDRATTGGKTGGGAAGAELCVPGQSVACVGPAGCQGGQVCAADGASYEACACAAAGAGGHAGTPDAGTGVPPVGQGWTCTGDANSCGCDREADSLAAGKNLSACAGMKCCFRGFPDATTHVSCGCSSERVAGTDCAVYITNLQAKGSQVEAAASCPLGS